MIEGVSVRTLEPVVDERGRLVELYRVDQEEIGAFGQVHMTTIFPGVVKAWHRHTTRTDVITVVAGMIRLGLYDDREGSRTAGELNQFFVGVHNPLRIVVPPRVWFGMKGLGSEESLVTVLTDLPYDSKDPDEERLDPEINDIPFDWDIKHR
ncbi:MAG: dTDP-4-dehydrorhamnose 3,5-epimerase family protein [Acidobacteriota bacterium]|nr:dTDP-4-dehydrorhamnose 3,5-epimerase family protein [Acidobacteriota bacterium]